MKIRLQDEVKKALVSDLKHWLDSELGVELGQFDAEFLLDFFTARLGYQFYNQGLADALQAFEGKIEEINDLVFELEQQGPDQG